MSALLIAAERNYVDAVKRILDSNGSISIRNKDKKTALILAAEKGNSKVVSTIIDHLEGCSEDIKQVVMEQDVSYGCSSTVLICL